MLHEAELFVMAEQMLVEVIGRVRPADEDLQLPTMHARAVGPTSVRQAVADHLREDALLTALLGGAGPDRDDDVGAAARAACAAAAQVEDGEALVTSGGVGLTAREHLLRATVERSLLAHYLAAYLGSTACPLPEELARPLSALTGPDAARWRELGYFRDPMPLPEHVSWRDRFLLDAGHAPHPLGH